MRKTASLVGVSHTAVHRCLQKHGLIGLRPRKLAKTTVEQIVQMYQAGHNLTECAQQLGHKIGTIAYYVRSAGIDVRPQPKEGADNPCWRGGRTESRGYICIYRPDHPHAVGGHVREHRLVMEEHLGRYLTSEEVVHHKNKNTRDNRLENLQLFATNGAHLAYELKGQCPKWTEEGKQRLREARHTRSPRRLRTSDHPTSCGEQSSLFPFPTET